MILSLANVLGMTPIVDFADDGKDSSAVGIGGTTKSHWSDPSNRSEH